VIDTVVEIDRMPLTFVATRSERTELLWRRARDALVAAVPGVLGSAVEAAFPDDASYVFIDHLDVTCAIRSDSGPEAIGSAFAEPFLRALESACLGGDEAVRYADRAQYLAAFLADLVVGDANGRWWFSEFAGLRPLPISSAVRTLVIQEGAQGWQAMAQLTSDLLRHVLLAVERPDVEAILRSLPAGSPTVSAASLFGALDRAPAASLPTERHGVLFAMVDLHRPDAGPRSAGDASCLGALRLILEAAREGRLDVADMAGAPILDWCDAAGIDAAGRLAVLELDADEVRARVVTELRLPTDPVERHERADRDTAFTPYGGALLLGVVLVRSGHWHAWQAQLEQVAPPKQASALASTIALRVVARAMRPRRPGLLQRDAVLWRAFGAGAPTSPRLPRQVWDAVRSGDARSEAAASRWLSLQARELIAALAESVRGCERSSATYLRTRLLSMPASVSGDGNTVRLGRAPLDVLLQMSGLTRATVVLPDGRTLVLTEDLGV
jgi:hypothetical protein